MSLAINYWAVLVAAVASFAIGWAWFSPLLFVKPWMRLRGKDPEAMMAGGMQMPIGGMAAEFVVQLVFAYVLARLVVLLGAVEWTGAVHLALWIWLGFYVTSMIGAVIWEKMPWKLFAIYAGRWLVSSVVVAVILAVWR